ncbi:KinB-signaling pathway activation protein [Sporosarcina sp. P21c]|uniref:KinB-signaling pathway activation protein n=1 Tax=unclassified Sporosarcina TaxID=2647733 RepID=UPI000C16C3E7|nr:MULTISPECIES: KinB-signaling pathway activation protein [unclassified Sporosarcina]PIC68408.1 KinB-signaling pathway activation protein [Sporosarcina sp. P16a]PIC88935.1 KinB-signaling pathway activation protein [Sporosarcina sp. P21c]PIC92179.1 KinB-signaling pathway activation protein [Sporosarcina sp. P25]
MTIRNWVKFFLRAMAIGGAITAVVGLIVRWDFFYGYLQVGEIWQFLGAFLWMIFLGFTMSVIAQMGFFAYLTVHQFGVNLFRTLTLWNWVQMLIIVVVLFDLVFFRFQLTKADMSRTVLYIFLLITLIAVSVVTAYFKAQWTKKHALISALFFMIVITTLEWLPALMVTSGNKDEWVTILLFPLLAVNAYQLLVLPKYNKQSDIDKEKLDKRRNDRKKTKKQVGKSQKN